MRAAKLGPWLCLLAAAAVPSPARAEEPGDGALAGAAAADAHASYAMFALVVGVNTSVDPGTPTLRYADDDAARYLDLFRSMGARAYVLTRLDENTRRLHPQIAAEAAPPVRSELVRAVQALAHDVDQARGRHVRTILYLVYAGHGNVKDGRGYITLEDAQIDAAALDDGVIDAIGADRTHVIVDACNSYFLALGRGPGGQRHEAHGFAALGGLRARDSVGLLLSTSSARESHEWSGFQAGVFSHEVRSALYGAADADGDGQVSYLEVSAFVDRANQSIPNEQYRPNVYARAPKDSPVLLDLRARLRSRIDVPSGHAGRYLLEDSRGVRVADFHSAAGQDAYLLRPPHTGRLYLRRLGDDVEYVIPGGADPVELASLTPSEPRELARGAANDAYDLLFSLPFGRQEVRRFAATPTPIDSNPPRGGLPLWRVVSGAGLLTAAAAAGVAGGLSLKSADDARSSQGSGADVPATNDRIRAANLQAALAFGGAGIAAAAGALLLLWPQGSPSWDVQASASAAVVSWRDRF